MTKKTKTPSSSPEFWLDEEAAQKACEFFPRFLTHVKGEYAGQPLVLQAWAYEQIIKPIFGWKRKDGSRKYRTVYVEVPRKNAKSTICAGIALYMLFCDGELGAEVYSAAADRDQAAIVFDVAKEMLNGAPKLKERAEVYRRAIVYAKTASSYKVLSADAYTKHGLNASAIIFDELHTQPNRELWDVLTTSVGSRRQPLTVAITTAGYDRNSLCYEIHDYAIKVRDGIIQDDSFLPVIFAAKEEDDWKDPKTWETANPGIGETIKRDYLEKECAKAQQIPAYQNTFKRLHLNIWTEQETRWLDIDVWDKCAGQLDIAELEGEACYAGLDLSTTTDITALVLVFPKDGKFYCLCYFWVPEENIKKRADRDRVPYPLWADQELIEPTEGNIIDYDVIRTRVNQLSERFHIKEIAIDRWNATQLATQLTDDGFTVIPFGQGFASMAAPTKELEKLILGGQLVHGGNPVLRWMASNVAVKQDAAGNMKPAKDKSTERIDGIVALIMAIGRSIVQPEEYGSIYEERSF